MGAEVVRAAWQGRAPVTPMLAPNPALYCSYSRATSSLGWTKAFKARAWGSAGGSSSPPTLPTGRTGLVGLLPVPQANTSAPPDLALMG